MIPQYQVLSQLDTGLIPFSRSPFAEGKCGYKASQYMAVGVPPVCSRVGAIEEIVRNGKDGILVEDLEDFAETLYRLWSDP